MLVYEDSLIIADYTRGATVAFDLESGTTNWSVAMQGVSTLITDIPRNRIYTATIHGSLREIFAIDAHTGATLWYNGEQNNQHNGFDPILLENGDLVAYGTLSKTMRHLNTESGVFEEEIHYVAPQVIWPTGYAWQIRNNYLFAIEPLTDRVVWQATEPGPRYCCIWNVQPDDDIFLTNLGADIVVYDIASGVLLWKTEGIHVVGYGALTEDTIYALDVGAKLHLLEAATGQELKVVQFQPAAPGHDSTYGSSESISSSLIAAKSDIVAIYFGDTDTLSVYRIGSNQRITN